MPNSNEAWTWGDVTIFSGIRYLSELAIDTDKNWLTHLIKNLGDPVDAQDAATRAFVLAQMGSYLPITGGTMQGLINMGGKRIAELPSPLFENDAATKDYVDTHGGGSVIVLKDPFDDVIQLSNQTVDIPLTELVLASYTSPQARAVILDLYMYAHEGGSLLGVVLTIAPYNSEGGDALVLVLDSHNGDVPGCYNYKQVICGMDANQRIEYGLSMDVGLGEHIDVWVRLCGYIEP